MRSPHVYRIIVALTVLSMIPITGFAGDFGVSPHRAQFAAPDFGQAPAEETSPPDLGGKKNVGRAVMFSLIVPGTGQLYSGSWLRALPWFAVEIAGWALFSQYHAKGTDKTDEFEAFAGPWKNNDPSNGNFNYDAYMVREYQVASNETFAPVQYEGSFEDWLTLEWEDRSSHLPAPYTHDIQTGDRQQYYEMIGKYFEQFGFGWIDTYDRSVPLNGSTPENIWSVGGDDIATVKYDGQSQLFFTYRDMRGEANDLLEKGNTMMELVLVNHVLSALDAAFAARSYNRKQESAGLGSMDLNYRIRADREGDLTRSLTLSMPLPRLN
ncbi:hypothetical protein HUU59_01720 [bacterium]|nr:hypothetical protein [bacterium]